jgi:putative transcriptional regulator
VPFDASNAEQERRDQYSNVASHDAANPLATFRPLRVGRISEKSEMSTIRRLHKPGPGRVRPERVRRTTDKEIEAQARDDGWPVEELDAAKWRKVYNPPIPDVKTIRRKLRMSQTGFARHFGFSVRTVQEWEQGRSVPDRTSRILLRVIEESPRTVERALRARA